MKIAVTDSEKWTEITPTNTFLLLMKTLLALGVVNLIIRYITIWMGGYFSFASSGSLTKDTLYVGMIFYIGFILCCTGWGVYWAGFYLVNRWMESEKGQRFVAKYPRYSEASIFPFPKTTTQKNINDCHGLVFVTGILSLSKTLSFHQDMFDRFITCPIRFVILWFIFAAVNFIAVLILWLFFMMPVGALMVRLLEMIGFRYSGVGKKKS